MNKMNGKNKNQKPLQSDNMNEDWTLEDSLRVHEDYLRMKLICSREEDEQLLEIYNHFVKTFSDELEGSLFDFDKLSKIYRPMDNQGEELEVYINNSKSKIIDLEKEIMMNKKEITEYQKKTEETENLLNEEMKLLESLETELDMM
tara:strand:+ start:790 stop:1227 length:438 start_codon:yes stop_codon:yes gene_type:complete